MFISPVILQAGPKQPLPSNQQDSDTAFSGILDTEQTCIRRMVDTIFDNGQMAIDYITDVLPGSEAWMRVHAYDFLEGEFPVIYNLKRPEHLMDDPRWQEIQNTPFRKAIETVGSLLTDAALIFTISQAITSSDCRHEVTPPDAAAKRSNHSAHVMAYGHADQALSHLSNS